MGYSMRYSRYLLAPLFLNTPLSALYAQNNQEAAQVAAPSQDSAPESSTDTIIVTAQKGGAYTKIDRTAFDIQIGPDAASLKTLDVLKRLPGVSVSPTDKVTMHGGANVGYLIDGQWVMDSVAMAMPASKIAKVELITNPPAEYASSGLVLINIILVKDASLGFSGSTTVKANTRKRRSAALDLSYGTEKWDFSGNFNYAKVVSKTVSDRITQYFAPSSNAGTTEKVYYEQTNNVPNFDAMGKITRRFDNGGKLDFTFQKVWNDYRPQQNGYIEINGPAGVFKNPYNRSTNEKNGYIWTALNYKLEKENDITITANVSVSSGGNDQTSQAVEGSQRYSETYNNHYTSISESVEVQKWLSENRLLTIGTSATQNPNHQEYLQTGYIAPDADYLVNMRQYRGQYAAYATYQTKLAGFGIKPGLRFEYMHQKGWENDQRVDRRRTERFILPSLHIDRKFGKNHTLGASITFRTEEIDPWFYKTSIIYMDAHTAFRGNPQLHYPTIRQAELNYNFTRGSLSHSSSFYYRDTKNEMNQIITLEGGSIPIIKPINSGSSKVFGLTQSYKADLFKGFELRLDVDISRKEITSPIEGAMQTIRFNGYDGKLVVEYAMSKKDKFSANASFYSARPSSYGTYMHEQWFNEMSYSHQFPHEITLKILTKNLGFPDSYATSYYGEGFSMYDWTNPYRPKVEVSLTKEF